MRARIRTATIAWLVTTVLAAAAVVAAGAATLATAGSARAAQVISNIAYAPAQPAGSRGHLLDLYLPDGGGLRPLVIWSSGSAWMSDNGKSGASAIAGTFNARGYAVAGVSVRSSSQAIFPAQAHDIKAAIRWLRANAGQFQLDPGRFAVMGDSSGGWVADMAALTGGVASLEGNIGVTGVSSAVQAGVAFFGPTDFLRMNSQRPPGGGLDHDAPNSPESLLIGCAIQTCPDRVQQANPIRYVDQNDPPMMLLHGQADNLVPHGQSVDLYNTLRTNCRDAQFFSVPGAGHGTSDVMSPSRFGSQTVRTTTACQETTTVGSPNPSWDTVVNFLNSALRVGGTTSPSASPSVSPSATPRPGACRASYVPNGWNNGFTANVTVTNTGTATINGWTVQWTWPGNQQVTNAWNAAISQSGSTATARNVSYNATIAPGASASFGFQGTYSGANTAPAQFTLNGTACTAA